VLQYIDMNLFAPIYSVVLLILLIGLSLAAESPLSYALSVATGGERPVFLLLAFMLTNPIGIFIDWFIGSLIIFGMVRMRA
jgi:hypothetical protein